jgi:hypothetical protein
LGKNIPAFADDAANKDVAKDADEEDDALQACM